MPLYILIFVVIIAPELYVLWRFVMFIARGKVPGLNPLGQILDFVMLVVYPAIAFACLPVFIIVGSHPVTFLLPSESCCVVFQNNQPHKLQRFYTQFRKVD